MRRAAVVVVLVSALSGGQVTAQRTMPPSGAVGLALGGGSARGLAHVGVLRWLDEHRVPVRYIAGTSMGGLVGGAYATGMTADEIARGRS